MPDGLGALPSGMPALLNIVVTAVLVFLISEASKRSTLLGAALASLPLTSILAMIWLYRDTGDVVKIAEFSRGVFWLVLPSLALFALMPPLLRHWHLAFPVALLIACVVTALACLLTVWLLGRFGVRF